MTVVDAEGDGRVAALVGKRQHAERQIAAGVDLIVAQGYEAGGHAGEIATIVRVPEVVDAVAPVPVHGVSIREARSRIETGARVLPQMVDEFVDVMERVGQFR